MASQAYPRRRARGGPAAYLGGGLLLALLLLAGLPTRLSGEEIMQEVSPLAGEPVTRDNEVELLVGGPEFYPRRLSLIEEAESTIDLFTFLWCPDRSGTRIAEALAAAAGRGVRVRVGVDYFNNKSPAPIYELLETTGVELLIFNPPRWGRSVQDRMHEKMMIVDGDTVLLGGANLCDEYMLEDADRGIWQDFELIARGPAAARSQARFQETWESIEASIRESRGRYRALTGGGPREVRASTGERPRRNRRPPTDLSSAHGRTGTAALIHYQQPYRERGESSRSMDLYCRLFDSAQSRIIVHTPYMAPPRAFKEALVEAAQRGVEVYVITNSPRTSDVFAVFSLAARSRYRMLLEAGVRVFESPSTTIHGKAIVIDDVLVAVGSHNFTHRSFRHNAEIKLLTDDRDVISRLSSLLERDISRYTELTLEAMDDKEPRGMLRLIGRLAGRIF